MDTASQFCLVNATVDSVEASGGLISGESVLDILFGLGSDLGPDVSTKTCLPRGRLVVPRLRGFFQVLLSRSALELAEEADRKEGKEKEEGSKVARKDLLDVILGNIN